jgi:hypothetical protein
MWIDRGSGRLRPRQGGPGGSPFRQAKVTIVQQTAGPRGRLHEVIDGELNKEETGEQIEFAIHSRYTFHRDARGVWRIADRQPTFRDWECRPR